MGMKVHLWAGAGATREGTALCPAPSCLWAGSFTQVRNCFTITHVPCQAVSSSLHTLTSHPGFIFPAKSPDRTWPGAPLSEAAMPRQALQISGLSEKAARVSRAPEGHPWLAGSSPPSTSSSPLRRARPAGDSSSFPAAQRVAGPQPPQGIRAMLSRSRSPHRCPARARPAQTGRLYLPRPPLESWHRLGGWKKISLWVM